MHNPTATPWSELLECVHCRGELAERNGSLRCRRCRKEFPVILDVPVLARQLHIRPAPEPPVSVRISVCEKYAIHPPDDEALEFIRRALAVHYSFGDQPADAENNYVLNRIGLTEAGGRQPGQNPPGAGEGGVRIEITRHYIPPRLPAGLDTSSNLRIRNTGTTTLFTTRTGGRNLAGWVLSTLWRDPGASGVIENPYRAPLPVSLAPGGEVTVPVHFAAPQHPGYYRLRIRLEAAADHRQIEWEKELPVWITPREIRRPEPVRRPVIEGYDEDHREGIRMVERAASAGGARLGLEIGGCSTPMTTHLPCEIVNTDIDAQTLQLGRFVFERRRHTNVRFLCCDAHTLPFRAGQFDFAAVFAALHHFSDPGGVLKGLARAVKPGGFVAVMCEPVGHYHGDPDPAMRYEMELGINEQRFSLEEYLALFRQAGLAPEQLQIDGDSLKTILRRDPNGK